MQFLSKNERSWKSDDIFQWLFHQKTNLIQVDPFWTDLIQSDQKINKVGNLMIYFNDYFIRNPIWSSLIHFFQEINKFENLMIYFSDYFTRNPIQSSLIHFDPFWTDLIQIKIKNQITIFILMVNVTIFHSNNSWLVKIQFDQVSSILDRYDQKNQKVTTFLSFM